MGMFDSVNVTCPHCSEVVEFQSKAGDCCLVTYSSHDVPLTIAEDLDGKGQCCDACDRPVFLRLPFGKRVAMLVTGRVAPDIP